MLSPTAKVSGSVGRELGFDAMDVISPLKFLTLKE